MWRLNIKVNFIQLFNVTLVAIMMETTGFKNDLRYILILGQVRLEYSKSKLSPQKRRLIKLDYVGNSVFNNTNAVEE